MIDQVVIEAPAKVNLTLNVLGKRADGYHELETVMQQISLRDRIVIKLGGQGIRITSSSGEIPSDEGNLAYKAAYLLCARFSIQLGLHIFIEKHIPVGAGLAGGSTDAASVILGLNKMFGLDLQIEEMQELGLSIGSDVPFCVLGGTALARGRGEILTPLPTGPRLEMVLVKPEFQLSTAAVYQGLCLERIENAPNNKAFLEAWRRYDIIEISAQMKNVLETVSIKEHPEIETIKQKLSNLGALSAFMSGSGPTVIGVFSHKKAARQARDIMKSQYRESYLVSSYDRGD